MTKKRFTETVSTMTVKDNQTGREYKCEMGIDTDLLELLNAQHETIEQLKKDNKILMDKVFEMRTNDALDRTEISRQHYSVDEFLEELEKW